MRKYTECTENIESNVFVVLLFTNQLFKMRFSTYVYENINTNRTCIKIRTLMIRSEISQMFIITFLRRYTA